MKNLENYGVTEMNAREMKRTDGGFSISFFGIYTLYGVLDGIKDNTRGRWFW